MHYSKIKGASPSLLGMGAMRLPQVGEGWGKPVDYGPAQEMIDYCVLQGVNYFDTAYVYHGGDSERFLGKALSKYPRDSYYLANKYNILAQPDYRAQFEEQLERLQTDYVDFYMPHGISDNFISGYLGNGCVEYFLEEKAKGRIKRLGFSFHGKPDVLRQALSYCEWDFAMIQLNYYDWFHGITSELYGILKENNIPILAMEPVHGGMLASLTGEGNAMLRGSKPDRSIASWAIRFVLGLPEVAVVLSGMSSLDQVKDNIATVKERQPLSADDKALLLEASALLYKSIGAPCTLCRYCNCPQGLDIPYILTLYNDYKTGGEWRLKRLFAFPPEHRPEACTGCKACVTQCPQNLDMPKFMAEIAEVMKGL